MKLPIVFRTVAQEEFDDAALWYDERRVGLGVEFVSEVQKVLEVIANHPARYPIVSGDVREALVRRFPYAIYFRARSDRVVILAVFHSARDPAIWQARAKKADR